MQVYPITIERGDLAAVRGTPRATRVRKSDHMLSVPPWRSFTLVQVRARACMRPACPCLRMCACR